MKVYLETDDEAQHLSGICSSISFESDIMQKALRDMFGCKDNEEIITIVINGRGIKAYFEYKK